MLEPRKSFKKSEILFIYLIVLHEKFLQFDWLRAVVFQLNLKYLHVKITNHAITYTNLLSEATLLTIGNGLKVY